jgi:N-acetylmuramoyl-L-alanine amidase
MRRGVARPNPLWRIGLVVVALVASLAGYAALSRTGGGGTPGSGYTAHAAAADALPARRYPEEGATFAPQLGDFGADFGVRRVVVDAGHGAHENRGNTSCFCVDEQDFTLVAAQRIAARLEATGHFEVLLTRPDETSRVAYRDRLDDAAAFGADAFVSIHSDVRHKPWRWAPEPGLDCPLATGGLGFAVLFSDEGTALATSRRRALARAIAGRMKASGFPAYGGAAYEGLYGADEAPGVFVDRHAPGQRIFVLRHAEMPSVILETHNALDAREALRWAEPETIDAAGDAVAAALADALR